MEYETSEQQSNCQHIDFEKFVKSASQNQVIEIIIEDKIREAVNEAVLAIENRMHDAILTAMHKVVIPRDDMAVKSITGSSRHEPNSEVQNPNRRKFFRECS